MELSLSQITRAWKQQSCTARALLFVLAAFLSVVNIMSHAATDELGQASPGETPYQFPTVPPRHHHARELLASSMRYVALENRMIDPISGYPFEGWNQDPAKGLYLRSFTQLTAIGQYMELLANIIVGTCDTPFLSRKQALANLAHVVKSLRQDQRDPKLSAGNLLGNFLDLATGKRLGPLAVDVEKHKFQAAFGRDKAEAIWKALQAKGWIIPRGNDLEADIARSAKYGSEHFDGPLAPFSDNATKTKIMDILDPRVVMVVFIDNANLSAAAAKTIGALLNPGIKDHAEIPELRQELERFLEDQQAGYARLFDANAGQFYFGRDATKDRHFGWVNLQGKWVTGHVDYLVNEFRGPATFVVTRFGLPIAAIKNLGFKMKPYLMQDARDVFVLAPWEGSAFQALGLELAMTELERPSWRKLLENVVDVEIDYSMRNKLPGFLSESYSGEGVQYTGSVGIPEITVSPLPRITDAASLYTLGAAYSVAPEKIEQFLAANWPLISSLLTEHGPWEGLKGANQEVIRFQTTAHTLALILGLLGTGSDHMKAYLESKGLRPGLDEIFKPGEDVDLLSSDTQVFAWNGKGSPIHSSRDKVAFHARTDRVSNAGIAFVPSSSQGANLSGGLLSLRYRSFVAIDKAVITLKPVGSATAVEALIPTQIFCHLASTGGQEHELRVPLPAAPGLAQIKEVVITFGPESQGRPIDLSVTHLRVVPIAGEGDQRQ
jgi:hypothetical protein